MEVWRKGKKGLNVKEEDEKTERGNMQQLRNTSGILEGPEKQKEGTRKTEQSTVLDHRFNEITSCGFVHQ